MGGRLGRLLLGLGFWGFWDFWDGGWLRGCCQNQDLPDFGIFRMDGWLGRLLSGLGFWGFWDFRDGELVGEVVVRIRIYRILGFSGWGVGWGGCCQNQDLPDFGIFRMGGWLGRLLSGLGFWGWGLVEGVGGGLRFALCYTGLRGFALPLWAVSSVGRAPDF